MNKMENVKLEVENVSSWLKNFMEKSGFKGLVLGVSGGIDSAVSLGIAIKSIGKENIKCFALPCTTTNEKERFEDFHDANIVAESFGVELLKIHLDDEATKLYQDIAPLNVQNKPLVLANIKARLRMATLRAIAESFGYLVLGTTNKTEEYLGYYTKAGDGGAGVDVEPIADYLKYEIRELAKELGVPEHIITKAPSAGLWKEQTDEDEIEWYE